MCDPSFVLSEASVVASMASFDRLNREERNFLIVSRNHDAVVRRQIALLIAEIVNDRPPNADWRVAFCYNAGYGDGFTGIYVFIVTECKWCDLGED